MASVISSVAFVQTSIVRWYFSPLVISPRRNCCSMPSIDFSAPTRILSFCAGMAISSTAMPIPLRVAYLNPRSFNASSSCTVLVDPSRLYASETTCERTLRSATSLINRSSSGIASLKITRPTVVSISSLSRVRRTFTLACSATAPLS